MLKNAPKSCNDGNKCKVSTAASVTILALGNSNPNYCNCKEF